LEKDNSNLDKDPFYLRGLALGGAAVILFERYEQKDKSGTPGPPFLAGNAQVKKIIKLNLV
jgi:hypothetical protein